LAFAALAAILLLIARVHAIKVALFVLRGAALVVIEPTVRCSEIVGALQAHAHMDRTRSNDDARACG
jgi:hypothetical protein